MKWAICLDPNSSMMKMDATFEMKKFFIGYLARIANTDENYFFRFDRSLPSCIQCGEQIVQMWASSLGKAGLQCACSVWEGDISPFSGSCCVTENFKRVHMLTEKEKAERALDGLGVETKKAILSILKKGTRRGKVQ